jgi:hypothetical protein
LVCQTIGGQFFSFCQNYMDAKLICQTVEVALSLVWVRYTTSILSCWLIYF